MRFAGGIGTGEMRLDLTRVIAISLAVLATGCSSGSSLFGPQTPAPALSPEQEAQEDQQCQSNGYQINTPAYQYCRVEIAKQREIAISGQPVPPMSAHR